MGLTSSSSKSHSKNDANNSRIIMTGFGEAGKSTVLCNLELDTINFTMEPTTGFHVETVCLGNSDLISWDLGGRSPARALLRYYCKNVQGLIFVVDSANLHRMRFAADELESLLEEETLAGCPLLVLANKNDLPGALTADEVTQHLRLTSDNKQLHEPDRPLAVFSICASSFDSSAKQAFEWMMEEIKEAEMETKSGAEVAPSVALKVKGAAAVSSKEPGKLVKVAENLLPKGLKRLLFA